MKFILTTFLSLLFFTFSTAQTGTYVPQLVAFDNAMIQLMNDYNVPGAQLAITYKGRLVYNRGFGLADVAKNDSVYPNSVFRIASVSKTITGVACMKLYEQGLLNFDAKVFGSDGILNDAKYQNIVDPRVKNITVRMLLHHEGGWNSNLAVDPMFNAYHIATTLGVSSPPTASEVIQYMLANVYLNFDPGTQSQYSNFGYCVLGRVIEKLSGQTYEDYVKKNILYPLGIADINMGKNLKENALTNEVVYYDYPGALPAKSVYDNTTIVPWPYGGFNLEFMDSHGGWVASCESLLKLVCAIDGFSTRADILKPASIVTLTTPTSVSPNYGFGIQVNAYNNWWHNGSLPGTTSEFVRNGSGELNWAILLNTRDKSGAINSAVDGLVWNVLPSISSWPSFDLFSDSVVTGVRERSQELEMTVYPNPASDEIQIILPAELQSQISVEIYNVLGQNVKTQYIADASPTLQFNTSLLDDGIYFVRVVHKDQASTVKKVMIKH